MTTSVRIAAHRYRDRVDCCFSRGRVLLLTVTSACNQKCIHCLRSAVPDSAEPLDMSALTSALQSAAADLRLDRVVISGGEPTLVPNILDLISTIDRIGLRPSLCTNAVLIDTNRAQELARSGLKSCTVGLEGVGDEYLWFRGGSAGGYGRAVRGIGALISAGVSVTVNISLHNRVLGQEKLLADDLRHLGLTSISVTSPILQGRLRIHSEEFTAVSPTTTEDFANSLSQLVDCPVSLRMPRCNQESCPSGRSVFSMDRNGIVAECPDVGSANVSDFLQPIGR